MALFVVLSALLLGGADANHGALSIWYRLGVVGIVLTLGSLVYLLLPFRSRRGERSARRQVGEQMMFTALVVFTAAFAEFVLVVLVGRSVPTAIAVLGVAQPVLVGAVALVASAFPGVRPAHVSEGPRRSWLALLGIAGMVITCGAMAAWMVNVLVVSPDWMPARWPGVLIAMAVLTGTAVLCAPGIIRRAESRA